MACAIGWATAWGADYAHVSPFFGPRGPARNKSQDRTNRPSYVTIFPGLVCGGGLHRWCPHLLHCTLLVLSFYLFIYFNKTRYYF